MKQLSKIVVILLLGFGIRIQAQDNKELLTNERIFASADFRSGRFGPAFWTNDGSGYTTLETSADVRKAVDIIKYDAKTGKREVLVSAQKMIPTGENEPIALESYSWSPDGQKLIIFTNSQRVWRMNTKGDYWILDLKTNNLFQLGKTRKPSSLMFAKVSPDGTKAAYVSDNNLYTEDLSTHKITQLTFDGSKTIINGTFDWVYEEEFNCRDGFRWSPDSKKIAFWQLDASGVRDFYMINNTDSLYPFIIPVQYPKVGQTLSACKVGVIDANGGAIVWIKTTGDPRNNYIPKMDWAASNDEILIQYLNRLQNTNQVILCNVNTGALKPVFTEKDSTWLDDVEDLVWLDNGKAFTWISERSGWRHVYLVSRDGSKFTDLTPGNFDAINVVNIDEKDGYLYFIASPDNSTQRYLFRSKLSGKGNPEMITPKDKKGTHIYQMSPNSKYAIHRFSTFDTPMITDLIELPSHNVIKVLVENSDLKQKIAALKRLPVEYFKVTIPGNISVDGWMLKPYNFDPAKKYPVLFYVYGEPANQTTNDVWSSNYLWHLMIAQKGYIVISMDTRGCPAPKGRAWRKACYQKLGALNSYEQAMAAREVGKWSFIDSTRFAIWGWSGGGSSTLNALFRFPEIYKTGIAVAPVADETLYDAVYQERYMGLYPESEKAYKECSALTFAKGLKGNLLIIHGTGDDNVHYQGVERLMNELIKNNKQFSLMAYPNRSHGINEGRGTSLHLRTIITNYLLNHLPAGGR